MRHLPVIALRLAIVVSSLVVAQTAMPQTATPQTARQALIEMLFGDAPDHFEKHLPDITRQTIDKLKTNGQGIPGFLSALTTESKTEKENLQTFDTGPIFLSKKGPAAGSFEKLYVTVERDELLGDEDRIELAPHFVSKGKEEPLLPMVLRFIFSMKKESGVWRLNEVSGGIRLQLADPGFLKGVEEYQVRQNEQAAMWSVHIVVNAERMYQAAQGSFACALADLGSAGKDAGTSKHVYLYDSQLAGGKKNAYSFAISDCDKTHYRIVAEPEVRDNGQRAFCSDESGTIRASADGKGATCVASGEVVNDLLASHIAPETHPSAGAEPGTRRVRIPQGVSAGLIVSKVPPVYPPDARSARIQGQVVLKAVIDQTGDVESLDVISGHPMLAPAALEAVKQWKYKPYMLNGKPVKVETQIIVNFTLSP